MSQSRATKRRYNAQTAPPDLAGSGVPESQWPSKSQYEVWWRFVWQPVVDVDGWMLGSCPLHDPTGERPEATAEFSFRMGSYRCLADDDEKPCHDGKRAGTLASIEHLFKDRNLTPSVAEEIDWDSLVEDTPEERARLAAIEAEYQQMNEIANRDWRGHYGKRGA